MHFVSTCHPLFFVCLVLAMMRQMSVDVAQNTDGHRSSGSFIVTCKRNEDLLAGTRAYMAPELLHMRERQLAYPWALDMFRCKALEPSLAFFFLHRIIALLLQAAHQWLYCGIAIISAELLLCLAALECCCMRWSAASVRIGDNRWSPSGALLVGSAASAGLVPGRSCSPCKQRPVNPRDNPQWSDNVCPWCTRRVLPPSCL